MAQFPDRVWPDRPLALRAANFVTVFVLSVMQQDATLAVAISGRKIAVARFDAVDVLANAEVDEPGVAQLLGVGNQTVAGRFDACPILQ
ncbi:MAG: hypothetical protein HRF50_11050 [Phycisphaerae bacterium]